MKNKNYSDKKINVRLMIIAFCMVLVTLSCEEVVNDELPSDPLVLDNAAIERFEMFVSNPDNAVDIQLGNYLKDQENPVDQSQQDKLIEESRSELEPLLNESLIFLKASGFNDEELIAEFGSLNDPGLVITAFVLLLGPSEEGVTDFRQIRSNNFMHCLGSATGLAGIWELATGTAAASRSAILRAVGKFARRSLGWIGAALFVGEFIQCYWGNNSVFDRT